MTDKKNSLIKFSEMNDTDIENFTDKIFIYRDSDRFWTSLNRDQILELFKYLRDSKVSDDKINSLLAFSDSKEVSKIYLVGALYEAEIEKVGTKLVKNMNEAEIRAHLYKIVKSKKVPKKLAEILKENNIGLENIKSEAKIDFKLKNLVNLGIVALKNSK